MEDGGWRMEDGGWRMEDGGWRMEDGPVRGTLGTHAVACLRFVAEVRRGATHAPGGFELAGIAATLVVRIALGVGEEAAGAAVAAWRHGGTVLAPAVAILPLLHHPVAAVVLFTAEQAVRVADVRGVLLTAAVGPAEGEEGLVVSEGAGHGVGRPAAELFVVPDADRVPDLVRRRVRHDNHRFSHRTYHRQTLVSTT